MGAFGRDCPLLVTRSSVSRSPGAPCGVCGVAVLIREVANPIRSPWGRRSQWDLDGAAFLPWILHDPRPSGAGGPQPGPGFARRGDGLRRIGQHRRGCQRLNGFSVCKGFPSATR